VNYLEETDYSRLERNLNAFAADKGELAVTIPMACIDAGQAQGR
jgi:hypothetical protein